MYKDTNNSVVLDKMDFKDAIKVLKKERSRYGEGKIEVTDEYERGFVKGLEESASILQRILDVAGEE